MNACLDDHTEFDELAVGWALYSLEPSDEARFAEHLHTCRQCAASIAISTVVLTNLVDALPTDEEPTPQLRDRISRAITQPSRPPALDPTAARPMRMPAPSLTANAPTPRQRWKWVVAAAALVAVAAALGGWNVALHADRNQQASLAQRYAHAVHDVTRPGARTVDLATTAGAPAATVVLHDGTIGVVTMRIPQNKPRTSTYVLWGMNPGHDQPRAIGTFDVTHRGINDSNVRVIKIDEQFPAYAVSREPGRHAPAQPSAIIATGRVNS